MTKTETVLELTDRIEREANEKKNHETRTLDTLDVGQVVRQGDIYVHRVAAKHPRGRALAGRQLVRGVTTGSRHVAEAPARVFEGLETPEWAKTALLGPLVESKERVRITHPEHAWLDLPAGTYQVTYQRDARTGGQVQD